MRTTKGKTDAPTMTTVNELKETRKEAKEIAKSVGFDHEGLYTGHTSKQKKLIAATAYILHGSATKAAKIAGVSKPTVLDWKNNSEWWPYLIAHLKEKHDEELEAKTGKVIDQALEAVQDRVVNGDVVMNYKTGEMEHKPISGKDMTIIFGTLYDKRQLMRNNPTSISDNKSEDQRLRELMQEFIKFSQARQIDGECRTIEAVG